MRRTAVLAVVLAVGAALLAACGSSEPPGVAAVTVGVSNTDIFHTPIQLAHANGYFRTGRLDVTFVTLTASVDAAALHSDSLQFLDDSPTDFLAALGRHIPETAVSVDAVGNPLGLIVSLDFARAHGLNGVLTQLDNHVRTRLGLSPRPAATRT